MKKSSASGKKVDINQPTSMPVTRAAQLEPAIVSSAHLAAGKSVELSEFEFGLIIAGNAFNRWMTRCMAAAGVSDMTTVEVLVLHHVNHRDRPKKLADIAFILNIEDTHVVNYALKKLQNLGLLASEKRGKEVLYSTNEKGHALCKKYFEIREQMLVSSLADTNEDPLTLHELARLLRSLSGLYDHASRSATSL